MSEDTEESCKESQKVELNHHRKSVLRGKYMIDTNLKPCPFCGGEGKIEYEDVDGYYQKYYSSIKTYSFLKFNLKG